VSCGLRRLPDVRFREDNYGNFGQASSAGGHEVIVKLLLEKVRFNHRETMHYGKHQQRSMSQL